MQHLRHWFDLGVSVWIGLFIVYFVVGTAIGLFVRNPGLKAEQLVAILHFAWLAPIVPLYWIMIGLSYVLAVPGWLLLGLVWLWQKIRGGLFKGTAPKIRPPGSPDKEIGG